MDPEGLCGEGWGEKISNFINSSDFQALSAIPFISLEVQAVTKGRVFWSGGEKALNAATTFALEKGMTTLEMTKAGKRLLSAAKATNNGWKYASKRFAQGAEGVVHVFRKAVVRTDSVWKTIEEPVLRTSSKVKEIIEHIIE